MDEKIETFKQSIHYRDICYFIDHIDSQDIFNSCMEDLGYTTGLILLSENDPNELKSIIMGQKEEIMVISFLAKKSPLAECVIYKINE